ncbi:MAG: Hsp20/alpha crystallin family protein [bacterium]
MHRCERRCGSLARRVLLPSCVTERNAKAELREGVLTLRLPKSRENSPHRISIN